MRLKLWFKRIKCYWIQRVKCDLDRNFFFKDKTKNQIFSNKKKQKFFSKEKFQYDSISDDQFFFGHVNHWCSFKAPRSESNKKVAIHTKTRVF